MSEGAFDEALALWRGPPLADLAHEPFARGAHRAPEDLRLSALELRTEAMLARGRHDEVVAELEALIAEQAVLESGSGKYLMRYGPERDDMGPFYAYAGTEEVLGGWRERVFGDVSWGQRQLAFRVGGYRPLALSQPYGNYGQLGTNDPEIPRLLLERLYVTFEVVFTQDRPGSRSPVRAPDADRALRHGHRPRRARAVPAGGARDVLQDVMSVAIATSSRSAAAR